MWISLLVSFAAAQSAFAAEDFINTRDYKSLAESQAKLLSIQNKSHAPPAELMSTLLTLGNAQLGMKQYAAAKSSFEQGARLAAQKKDSEQIANFERQLGTVALRQSDYRNAIRHYVTALHLDEPKGQPPNKRSAKDYYCLGRLLEKQTKWLEAKEEYNSSVTGFEIGYGKNCSEIMVPIWCLYACAKGRRDSVEDKICWAKLQQLQKLHQDFQMLPVEQEQEFFDLWFKAPVITKP